MARWRLLEAHYLNVPGTEWEYKETDRDTGRQHRMVLPVPLYLNPKDEADWNYRDQQSIIVSNKFDKAYHRDYVFAGPPTPNMEPIDEEAEQITRGYVDSGAWKHPIESLNMTYSESLLSNFEQKLASLMAGKVELKAPETPPSGVSKKQFDELQATVRQLMEQNASLQAQILEKPKSIRRF